MNGFFQLTFMQLLILLSIAFLMTACGSTVPIWRPISASGVSDIIQTGDFPINDMPATPSQVQNFELFDTDEPVRLGFYFNKVNVPTPLSIPDAKLISTLELIQLLQENKPNAQSPILIDVRSHDSEMITIRGAWWLNGLGYAYEDPLQEENMNQRMEETLQTLSPKQAPRPLVFFCAHPHCALSYNAARRAAKLGHPSVYWYRGGVEAWYLAGLPLVKLKVRPAH